MAILELRNLTYEAENTTVLKNVNLKIEKGTVSALLGLPGSGKSTALKMLAGILFPTSGQALYNDKIITDMNRKENQEFRKHCGFMFQDSALWANQDIFHNFLLPLQIHYPKMSEKERNIRINDIVKKVGYDKLITIRPAGLSIGEQKRVGFGRALMCEPEVLFLDEPTESLDFESGKIIYKLLNEFVEQGNTLVFVSHDNDFVNSFKCDKYYFEKGTIVDRILLQDEIDWEEE